MPDQLVAVLDADVLVPILSCDLLLTAFDHDLYQPVVTRTILSEVERSLRHDFPRADAVALARRGSQMAEALALHTHPDAPVTAAVVGVNRKDRHLAAIALAANADVVVSNDQRLRSQIDQLGEHFTAVTADAFMVNLHASAPERIEQIIEAMITKRVRRPIARDVLLDQLAQAFPRFTAAVR